jgi:hypothetical protein
MRMLSQVSCPEQPSCHGQAIDIAGMPAVLLLSTQQHVCIAAAQPPAMQQRRTGRNADTCKESSTCDDCAVLARSLLFK